MSGLPGIDRRPAAVILDFDGVVLSSVEIKAQAYAEIYRDEDASKIAEVMAYQHLHGGVSRREKFRYFEREVFGRVGDQSTIENLSARYTSIVHEAVVQCPFIDGAYDFIASNYRRIALHVVSGTPQNELCEIIERRALTPYFRTIAGAPAVKLDAFRRILESSALTADLAVAVGDSHTEYAVAKELGIPFVGVVDSHTINAFPGTVPVLSNLRGLADLLLL